jgi:signal transduction histidine kinase
MALGVRRSVEWCVEPRAQRGTIFRMASFRLAVLGTLLSTIGAIMVFALIYAANSRAAYREFNPIVAGDRADLLADALSAKISIGRQIDLDLPESQHIFYALSDRRGRQIAGNVVMPARPLVWQDLNRWSGVTLPAGIEAVDGIGAPLPDGSVLFVGEDASVFAQLNHDVADLFGIVFGLMILTGLLASMLIASYSLKRVRAISEASAQIIAGDLSHRIALYGIDDELDFLTADLNRMLGTIEVLVENARQATSDIAHDLRTPLTRLHDHLVVAIRRVPKGDTELGNLLGLAVEQTDQLSGMFNALLRLAEVEAGAVPGHFTLVDLSALCQSIGDSYQPVAEDRGQTLVLEIEPGHRILADRDLINQMIVNVVENAINYSPSGVSMTLRSHSDGDWVSIDMADRGPGIAPADYERAFRRFVRLDAARHTVGFGLGLPLVRAIAALHEGEVSLHDNAPGLLLRIVLHMHVTSETGLAALPPH